jgi:hypothetical protein
VVLVHAIIVIQHKYVVIEVEGVAVVVLAAVVEQVVQQVDIIIINNNGMDPMAVPVVIGLAIIKLVVAMIVFNNKLLAVMGIIVSRIRVGGTVHHETKTKIKLNNIPPCDA